MGFHCFDFDFIAILDFVNFKENWLTWSVIMAMSLKGVVSLSFSGFMLIPLGFEDPGGESKFAAMLVYT